MTTERIDVLAVMQKAEYDYLEDGFREAADAMGLARAAVAELIEADKEYDAANEEITAQTDDEDGMYSLALERLRLASSRRAVALARVGGA